MSSSLRRGAVAATVIALSTLSLGACGAGFDAQTDGVRPDNASASVDDVKVQNVNIVTSKDGDGPAVVTAHLFNEGNQEEKLRGITVEGVGEVKLSSADLVVPAGGSLVLGGKNNASAVLEDTEGIANGNAQPVSFDLSGTGAIELDVTVVPARGEYEKWGPTAQPSPTQQPEEEGQDGQQGSPSPDGTEGAENADDAATAEATPDGEGGE